MSDSKLDFDSIRSELETRKDHLRQSITAQTEKVSDSGGIERGGTDRGDESHQELQTSMRLERADRETYELALVQQALDRIDNGDYGICIDCGEEIDAARLEANPISKRCLPCQEKREDDRDERDATPSL